MPPARFPAPGRVFHDERHAGRDAPRARLRAPLTICGETLSAIACAVRTQMRVDVVDLARRGDREIAAQQPERLAHDRRIVAPKIDQVGGMDRAALDARLARASLQTRSSAGGSSFATR